jgi:hypothetical protein
VLTVFAIPKPFHGHTGIIQRNAIGSWARLEGVEVLLLGDDEGVAETAREVGARHLPGVETNSHGTPLVSSAFELARTASAHALLAYANADIIFLPDLVASLSKLGLGDFLVAGQRWEVDLRAPIDFDDPQWEHDLRMTVGKTGYLQQPNFIDYFVFRRDAAVAADLPAFAVGRPRWDNWLIRRARQMRIPVMDGTSSITAIHQRHDYSHVPGGTGRDWYGPEATSNIELFGDGGTIFGIWHATHLLRQRSGPVPALGVKYLRNRWWTRHEVDGGIERLARMAEPVLVPALRLKHLLRRPRSAPD